MSQRPWGGWGAAEPSLGTIGGNVPKPQPGGGLLGGWAGGPDQQPGGALGGWSVGPGQTAQSPGQATPRPGPGGTAPAPGGGMLGGLLGQVQQNLSTPLTFQGSPGGAAPSIASTASSERIAPGHTVSAPSSDPMIAAPDDVEQIAASQQGQYGAPKPMGALVFDPESGRYIPSPDPSGWAQQGNELEQATFQRGLNRINPGLEQQQNALSQRLVNQGLPIGSEAYNDALNRLDQSQGDQRENLALSSIGAGRQEQGRLFGQDLASRQFGAGEEGRQFAERLGATQFNADERGRQFGQEFAGQQFQSSEAARQFAELMAGQAQTSGINMGNRRFSADEAGRGFDQNYASKQFSAAEQARSFQEQLASQGQFFNQNRALDSFRQAQANTQASGSNAARSQGIREQMLLRQQPLNELSQLLALSGGAPSAPQFGQTPQFPVIPGDYQGQVNLNYAQESQNYQNAPPNPWLGAAGGIAQAAIPFIPGLGIPLSAGLAAGSAAT